MIPSRTSNVSGRLHRIMVLLTLTGLFVGAGLAGAQTPLALDSTCTATVGNQTAFVGDDGKFLLQNVALFQDLQTGLIPELYRIRATCLREGQMITGQSPYFTLSPGQTTIVTQVFPSDLDPIPVFIELSASYSLVGPGATVQLTVIAHYADGSTRDVTARSAGTVFLSTNRDLLTVDETGLVTGANAGTFNQMGMVSAINEGNTATVFIESAADSNDLDGDGLPNDYEDLYGFDKLSYDSYLDPDDDGLTNLQEFQIGTLPNNPDTDLDGILDGVDGDPLRPESDPPTVTITAPAEGSMLFSGQTLHFTADARDDGRIASVELLVNGASFAMLAAPPYELSFNVPFATSQLTLTARATDGAGRVGTSAATLAVAPDPLTTVQGRVQDTEGVPVSGASVTLGLQGLKGEFFDFATPLSSLPDLTGLTPGATRFLPGLGFRNPGSVLSPDTFGLGFSPDYAGRFTGLVRIPFSGSHEVLLGADDGARLSINGTPVVEVIPNGGFREATGTVNLNAGTYPIQIDYFQSVADAEIAVAIHAGGGGGPVDLRGSALQQITAGNSPVLLLSPSPFVATTGADGSFSIPNVPTILGNVGAGVAVTIDDVSRTGTAAEIPVVPGGTTDFGAITLDPAPICLTGTLSYARCLFGPVTEPVNLYEQDPSTGVSTVIQQVIPDPTGRFAAFFRRDRIYFFRREEATCNSQTAPCTSFFINPDPPAALTATDEVTPDCRDIGNVTLVCDFFGGS